MLGKWMGDSIEYSRIKWHWVKSYGMERFGEILSERLGESLREKSVNMFWEKLGNRLHERLGERLGEW